MANLPQVALILGAGSNIGQHLARAFTAKGYKVAIMARSLNEADSTSEQLHVKGDLTDLRAVEGVFAKVKTALGAPPSVVIHNAGALTPNPADDPLLLPLADFTRDLTVNTS
ncbi:hypothetical protein ACHAQH_002543 [Verticillium albo-atrum]